MEEQKEKIRAFLSRFFRAGNLNDEDDIFALGVNSLFAMQLVAWVEKEFNIQVTDEDLEVSNFNSVSALAAFLGRKGVAQPNNGEEPFEKLALTTGD